MIARRIAAKRRKTIAQGLGSLASELARKVAAEVVGIRRG
jgi:hypothetical protein